MGLQVTHFLVQRKQQQGDEAAGGAAGEQPPRRRPKRNSSTADPLVRIGAQKLQLKAGSASAAAAEGSQLQRQPSKGSASRKVRLRSPQIGSNGAGWQCLCTDSAAGVLFFRRRCQVACLARDGITAAQEHRCARGFGRRSHSAACDQTTLGVCQLCGLLMHTGAEEAAKRQRREQGQEQGPCRASASACVPGGGWCLCGEEVMLYYVL